MRNRIDPQMTEVPFWPPRPSAFWQRVLSPLRRYMLKRSYGVTRVEIDGLGVLDNPVR